MFEIREFNLEVQQQVDMKLSHSPQALAWGEWPANHRTVLTVCCRDRGRVHDYDKPLKRFNSCSCVGTPS
jgi:hypothetical protein